MAGGCTSGGRGGGCVNWTAGNCVGCTDGCAAAATSAHGVASTGCSLGCKHPAVSDSAAGVGTAAVDACAGIDSNPVGGCGVLRAGAGSCPTGATDPGGTTADDLANGPADGGGGCAGVSSLAGGVC